MAKRWYCPQWKHKDKGWINLPTLASKKKKGADDNAKEFAEKNTVVVRTHKMPKGWMPDESN